MKREEAIKLLNDIHSQCCDTANILCTLDADKRCDALQLAIIALQNQPVWIPVSERLPEELVPVNVTWINRKPEPYYAEIKDVPFACTAVYYNGKWYWWSSVCTDYLEEYGEYNVDLVDKYIDIVAWMPLPEPYRESEPHKQTNADRIRSMTDEELADFLVTVETYGYHDQSISGTYEMNEWLLMESEEEDGKV